MRKKRLKKPTKGIVIKRGKSTSHKFGLKISTADIKKKPSKGGCGGCSRRKKNK